MGGNERRRRLHTPAPLSDGGVRARLRQRGMGRYGDTTLG